MKGLGASFCYAWRGIVRVCQSERNMKIHLVAAALALILSGFFHLSWLQFMFILVAIAMVIVAEAINTAIEAVVDLVTAEKHPLAAQAKDIAAGAVLVAAIFAFIVGVVIFGPHFLVLFGVIPNIDKMGGI
ncbi:MAG: diacylglycerol kinase family protein [Peptococcaceae bacterium]|nr:diacylglycerol kinase family protein [Peptococcaceae bacterium]